MRLGLDEETEALQDLIRTIGRERLRPTAFERRHEFAPPEENLRLLGEAGLLGVALPEKFGGSGRPELDAIIVLEEMAYACPVTAAYAILTLTGPGSFITKVGTNEQCMRYLPGLCTGERRFSISMTEPDVGSATTDLTTKAVLDGDVCRLNGQKVFCSGAPHSDHFLVFVRFGPGTSGVGAVVVNRETPGFTIGPAHRHMSGETWSELWFDDATIPLDDIIASDGAFSALMSAFSLERCGAAAYVIGTARIAFDLTLEYVQLRTQFGRPIIEFQSVQNTLADMYIALEEARLLTHRAIARSDDGLPSRLDSSAAKIAATEAASLVCDSAMQLHGGTGMSQEMPLEWLYRVVRPYRVAGGTNEVLRSGLASALIGRSLPQRPS